MRSASVEILADCRGWAAIGIVESLKVAPGLRFQVYPMLLREIRRRQPSLVIPIDFGAFNVAVCRWCKRQGVRVLYYLPPGSWRKEGPLPTNLASITDAVATQFPWSDERLRTAGARSLFVGHPLLDLIGSQPPREDVLASLGFDPNDELIALLPGSRTAELVHNTPAMAEAALVVHQKRPSCRFVVALSSGSPVALVEQRMRKLLRHRDGMGRPVVRVVQDMTHAVLASATAGLVCSGTATLEAAILQMPMVILYRGSGLMYVEYVLRRIGRLQWIGLPNIIAGRTIVPELVAAEASPENLSTALLEILSDARRRESMLRDLAGVRDSLGSPGATERTAELALSLITETAQAV